MSTQQFAQQFEPGPFSDYEGAKIPGIRRWPQEYLPKIFDKSKVDQIIDIDQESAEETTRALATKEGILAGISSGGAMAGAPI